MAAGIDQEAVLEDWTRSLQQQLEVLHHFDMRAGPAIYRVFLFQNCLELDLGLWPEAQFGPRGAAFRLMFGQSVENVTVSAFACDNLIGLCWHHALHAHVAIERSKPWEAEYYISALRDHSLEIACLRLGLPAVYARGTDKLPSRVKGLYENALVRSLGATELRRALLVAASAFLGEIAEAKPKLAASLRACFDCGFADGETYLA
ncbi:MAG: nucleotidyltransferase domain-containing protein [Candidatus Baltobacteraceae bacterium]